MPASPPAPLRRALLRWTRASNRRRVAEEGIRALSWMAVAAVVAVGIHRMLLGIASVGLERPGWLPDDAALGVVAWSLLGSATAIAIARGILRTRHRSIDVPTLARRIDREHATDDALSTALALEDGSIAAPVDLAAMVTNRAQSSLTAVDRPIEPFAAPSRALATVGAVAAVVALLPASAESILDLAVPPANAAMAARASAPIDPPLSEQALERLTRDAEALAELERRPALRESARERLQAAREQLESLRDDPSRSLGKLSRAEQALRELERQGREDRLYDAEELRSMERDELAEAMTRALERNEHDAAAAMAEEMARRLEDADERELGSMARALDEALRETPSDRPSPHGTESSPGDATDPSDSGTARSAEPISTGSGTRMGESGSAAGAEDPSQSGGDTDPSARWRRSAESLPERLRSGDAATAREKLRRMAEEMARSGGSKSAAGTTRRALEDIRRARSEQLAELNGEGKPGQADAEKPGEGDGGSNAPGRGSGRGDGDGGMPGGMPGEGPGEPGGTGVPFGLPGGKPGPGGGKGSDALGDPEELPMASLHPAEKVETTPDGPARGAIRVIRRFTEGHRDTREYEDLHHEYESVAESAVRREEIPLTRRDYIRDYFQAVRPR